MRGQTFLETVIGVGLMLLVAMVGLTILLKGVGTLIATRWAASNSRCIAVAQSHDHCNEKTARDLARRFSFHHVKVKSHLVHGIIHSSVQAEFGGYSHVNADFDLAPTEYTRVSQ